MSVIPFVCGSCAGYGVTNRLAIGESASEHLSAGVACRCPAGEEFSRQQMEFMTQGPESDWPRRRNTRVNGFGGLSFREIEPPDAALPSCRDLMLLSPKGFNRATPPPVPEAKRITAEDIARAAEQYRAKKTDKANAD